MKSALNRYAAAAALAVSMISLVFASTGVVEAAKSKRAGKAGAVVRLDRKGLVPLKQLPKVRAAKEADSVGGLGPAELVASCAEGTIEIGEICLESRPHSVDNEDLARSDFAFATTTCGLEGGFLPSAALLLGAADEVGLAGTVDDDRLTASVDVDPSDGTRDRREMSSTLVTTAAGSSAAGSQGTTEGSRGDPRQGEPDPVPRPSNPRPDTLQYVTVYDNRNKGGFAGSRSINQPELFRCAYVKAPGGAGPDNGEGGGGDGGLGGEI